MNAPLGTDSTTDAEGGGRPGGRPRGLPELPSREIPYNYTSFTDREISHRYLGDRGWALIVELRGQRRTGQSARMLFEVLGDLWVIDRNPFIQDDLLENRKRRDALVGALRHRVEQIEGRIDGEARVIELVALARGAIAAFEGRLGDTIGLRRRIVEGLRGATHPDNVRFDGLSRVWHAEGCPPSRCRGGCPG